MQIAYTGDEALLTIGTGPDHGMIDISINDWFWRSFNTYTAQPGERVIHLPQVTTPTGETSGTLEIRNRSDRHHRSTGYVFRFKQLQVIDATYNERTIDYTYDNLSRLTQADYDNGTTVYDYGYDLAGNLVDLDGTTRTYNAANQMTNDGTNTLTYDANGNLTSDGTNTYTWDHANCLTQIGNTTYTYDGLGNRTQQTTNRVVTDYLLDLQPGLVKVLRQSDGTATDHFIHAPRGIHAQSDGTHWQYITQDGLGSVRSLIDSTLGVDTTHNYDPYGNYIGTPPTTAYFGFTGEQTDANGQLYLRARYYNPALATFSSLDPFEGVHNRPMSLNGYSWVEGNTPNMTDPSGRIALLAALLNAGLCQQQGSDFCRQRCGTGLLSSSCIALCELISQPPSPTPTPTPTPVPPTPTPTPPTPTPVPPTPTPTPQPPTLTPTIVYFGGSALGPDLDTTNINYSDEVVGETEFSFIEGQAPHLFGAADYAIPYPGTPNQGSNGEVGKELQALNATNQVLAGADVISLGYSAGADAALIFTYRYRNIYNMVGVGILGGTLDGGIRNNDGTIPVNDLYPQFEGTNIDWQSMVQGLLANQIRVYILDDNVVAPDFSTFVAAQQGNQYLCHDNQPALLHFLPMNSGTNSTNRDASVPANALAFLRDGDRSRCS